MLQSGNVGDNDDVRSKPVRQKAMETAHDQQVDLYGRHRPLRQRIFAGRALLMCLMDRIGTGLVVGGNQQIPTTLAAPPMSSRWVRRTWKV